MNRPSGITRLIRGMAWKQYLLLLSEVFVGSVAITANLTRAHPNSLPCLSIYTVEILRDRLVGSP